MLLRCVAQTVSESFFVYFVPILCACDMCPNGILSVQWHLFVNPRPVGLWRVTHSAGEWRIAPPPPPWSPQTTGPNFQIKRHSIAPVRELSKHVVKFDLKVTDDVTAQVKVRMFDFSGLVILASKIAVLCANKVNESTWIVSLTFVSIMYCVL